MKSEMNRKDLDRYKRALLEKRGEMSITSAEAESPIPAAGGQQGDPVDQASANAEAELQIQMHQTDLRLLRAIEEALARIRHGTFGTCEALPKSNLPGPLRSCALDSALSRLQRARTTMKARTDRLSLCILRSCPSVRSLRYCLRASRTVGPAQPPTIPSD